MYIEQGNLFKLWVIEYIIIIIVRLRLQGLSVHGQTISAWSDKYHLCLRGRKWSVRSSTQVVPLMSRVDHSPTWSTLGIIDSELGNK